MRTKIGTKGIGLMELVIACTIGAFAMVTMTTLVSHLGRVQKRLDLKSQVQDLEIRLRHIFHDRASCQANLPLSGLPPIDPDDWKNFKSNVTVTLGGGRQVSANDHLGDIKIDSLQLVVLGEILPQNSGHYEAQLNLEPAPVLGGTLSGGNLRQRSISLVLFTEPAQDANGNPLTNAKGAPLRKVISCDAREPSSSSPNQDQMCTSLGGRWISSLSKCHWGGDLKLNQFECVAGNEFGDGGALEHAVLTKCFYKSGSQMLSQPCYNQNGKKIAQCVCQSGQTPSSVNGWVTKYPNKPSNSIIRNCDGGVLVQTPDEREKFLGYDEVVDDKSIDNSTVVTLDQFMVNYEMLDSVVECYPRVDSIQSRKCKQDNGSAMGGMTGSCIFVNGSSAKGTKAEGIISPYTGWIYVTRKRSLIPIGTGSARNMVVAEAAGTKCQQIKRIAEEDKTLLVRLGYNEKQSNDVNLLTDLENHWNNIRECLFVGGRGGDNEPTPSVAPASTKGLPGYRGEYIQRFSCDQEDIDPDNLTGDVGKAVPSLKKGSCWYFSNVILKNDYAANTHVSYDTAKKVPRYTGWVYLTANIRDNKFDVNTDKEVVLQSGSKEVLVGVPCNLGIRITQ